MAAQWNAVNRFWIEIMISQDFHFLNTSNPQGMPKKSPKPWDYTLYQSSSNPFRWLNIIQKIQWRLEWLYIWSIKLFYHIPTTLTAQTSNTNINEHTVHPQDDAEPERKGTGWRRNSRDHRSCCSSHWPPGRIRAVDEAKSKNHQAGFERPWLWLITSYIYIYMI